MYPKINQQQKPGIIRFLGSDIKKFQALYLKYFNEEISSDKARIELTLLVRQIEIVYQPISTAQFDKYITNVISEGRGSGTLT